MTPNGRGHPDVPHDLALTEAFDAFLQQTQVPEDFYTGVLERVHYQRVRRRRWGWGESIGRWWTPAWSPLGVWAATVCGLLSLALNVGLGYYAWHRLQVVTRPGHELAAAQAQVRAMQAEQQAWQARQAALTDQLAVLQAQAQQTAHDNAALRDQLAAAHAQGRQRPAAGPTAPPPGTSREAPGAGSPSSPAPAVRVQAQVGIQVRSGARSALTQATETLKAGDALRVYIIPEDDAYVYVVHNDGKTLTLLNAQDTPTPVRKGALLTLPAPAKFYQIDGTSDTESITVICSPTEMRAVTSLFQLAGLAHQTVPQPAWTALEHALMDQSQTHVALPADQPFPGSEHGRGIDETGFGDTLQTFSGQHYVIQKYDFHIRP